MQEENAHNRAYYYLTFKNLHIPATATPSAMSPVYPGFHLFQLSFTFLSPCLSHPLQRCKLDTDN